MSLLSGFEAAISTSAAPKYATPSSLFPVVSILTRGCSIYRPSFLHMTYGVVKTDIQNSLNKNFD